MDRRQTTQYACSSSSSTKLHHCPHDSRLFHTPAAAPKHCMAIITTSSGQPSSPSHLHLHLPSTPSRPLMPAGCRGRRRQQQAPGPCAAAAAAASSSASNGDGRDVSPSSSSSGVYSLKETTALVETAMLAAVSGLAYLVATILKIENTVGYFLPLPVVLASMRSGIAAGWKTMMATGFLLVVLLGPLRAISYLLLHGSVAATLGTLWRLRLSWWPSIAVAAVVRMLGQLAYLLLSSVTMNENFFWVVLNNVYTLLDQISAAVGAAGSPSTTTVACMLFSLLLVNSLIYCFLLHVVYRLILQAMGFDLGPLPAIVQKYLYAGLSEQQQQMQMQQVQQQQQQAKSE